MQQHYTNDTCKPQYVGGKLIPPGETRLVDLPTVAAAPAAAEPAADPLVLLSKRKVTDIVAALPSLASDDIDKLLALERAHDKPRTTLVQALELRKLEIIDMVESEPSVPTGESTDADPGTGAPAGMADGTASEADAPAAGAPAAGAPPSQD